MSGKGVWMVSITLVETSLSSISYGWLWAGIFFLFILLVALSSIFGYLEVRIPSLCMVTWRSLSLHLLLP